MPGGSDLRFWRGAEPGAPKDRELAKLGRSANTLPFGAPMKVIILLRKRTMLSYLVEPHQQLWRSGSEQ